MSSIPLRCNPHDNWFYFGRDQRTGQPWAEPGHDENSATCALKLAPMGLGSICGAEPFVFLSALPCLAADRKRRQLCPAASALINRSAVPAHPIASAWWHATRTPATGRSIGRSATHSSVAYGQREANTQPAGGSIGEGGSPRTGTAALW